MKVSTVSERRALDRTAIEEFSVTEELLMENAPAGSLVESILSQLEKGGILVMALVSASPIVIENCSENLWGRDIRTLYNLNRGDAQAFIETVDQLDLDVGTSVFLFEALPDVLLRAKQGRLEQPNAVIKIAA